jgi:hypothetical protein
MKAIMAKEKLSTFFPKVLCAMLIAFLAEASFAATYIAVLETVSQTDLLDRSEKIF